MGRVTEPLALELRDVFRIHPDSATGAVALQGMTLSVAAGRALRRARSERLGQEHAARDRRGLRPAVGRRRAYARRRRRGASARGARRPSASQRLGFLDQHYARALSPALTCAENVALPLALAGSPAARAPPSAPSSCSTAWASQTAPTIGPRSSRAASSSGWPPARRSPTRPRCCSPTSRRASSTRAPRARVYRLLGEIVAPAAGTTLVVVSHDEAATELADRVVHVRDGRISGETLRGGRPKLVVGRGGWVRLPESARDEAGIGDRAELAGGRRRGRALRRRRWPARRRRAEGEARRATARSCASCAAIDKGYGAGARAHRVLDGFDAVVHARAAGRRRGPLRLGQDDAAAPDRGARAPRRRHGDRRGRRPRRRSTARQLAAHRRDHIGWVGQEPGLVPFATALENVLLALEIHAGGRARRARARGARLARAPRPGRLRGPRRRPPLGGRATARRDRPRARPPARRRAARRADRAARPGERRARRRPARQRRAALGRRRRSARRTTRCSTSAPTTSSAWAASRPGPSSPRRGRSCARPRCRAAPRPCRRARPCPCPST